MLILESIESFTKSLSESPQTQKTYTNALRSFMGYLHNLFAQEPEMADLHEMMLVDFAKYLSDEGLKSASVRLYVAGVSAWLNVALIRKQLPDGFSLERARALYKHSRRRSNQYHPKDIKIILKFPKVVEYLDNVPLYNEKERKGKEKYLSAMRDRAFGWFIYCTGARQGTARNLKIEQLFISDGIMGEEIDAKGKGDKENLLLLDLPEARNAIAEYLSERRKIRPDKSDYLFISHSRDYGEPISSTTAWRIIHNASKAIGFTLSPHYGRHYWAVAKLKAGATLQQVSGGMAHSDISTTSRIYGRYTKEDLVSALKTAKLPSIKGE